MLMVCLTKPWKNGRPKGSIMGITQIGSQGTLSRIFAYAASGNRSASDASSSKAVPPASASDAQSNVSISKDAISAANEALASAQPRPMSQIAELMKKGDPASIRKARFLALDALAAVHTIDPSKMKRLSAAVIARQVPPTAAFLAAQAAQAKKAAAAVDAWRQSTGGSPASFYFPKVQSLDGTEQAIMLRYALHVAKDPATAGTFAFSDNNATSLDDYIGQLQKAIAQSPAPTS